MRKTLAFLALLFIGAPAFAQPAPSTLPITVGPAPGVTPDQFKNVPRANLQYAQPKLQPIAVGANLPSDGGLTGPNSYQGDFRKIYVFPAGAAQVAAAYSNTWTNSAVETDLADPQRFNLGLETSSTGSVGTGATTCNSGVTTCRAMTLKGQRPLVMPTITNFSGASVVAGFAITDAISTNQIPVGGTAAVRGFFYNSPGQVEATGIPTNYDRGEGCAFGAGTSDLSITGASIPASTQACPTPTAILGVPLEPITSACLVGDSLGSGRTGLGIQNFTVSNGGSGFVNTPVGSGGDIGRTFTITSATPANVGTPAQGVILAVSGGAVTSVAMTRTGTFAVIPTSPATVTINGGSGTGLVVGFVTGPGYDDGDAYGGRGYLQRSLDPDGASFQGIPYVAVTRGADAVNYGGFGWVARSYSRIAQIKEYGCRDVLWQLGINDLLSGGVSANTLMTSARSIWSQFTAAGINVYGITIPPGGTSSIDGYTTLDGQTINAAVNTQRVNYNADMKLNGVTSYGLSGVFDAAAAIDPTGSGKFPVNGTIGYCTIDGLHPMNQCITLLKASIIPSTLK